MTCRGVSASSTGNTRGEPQGDELTGPFSTNVFKLGPKNDVITNVMNLSKITKTMNYKRSRTGYNSAMNFKLIQSI